MTSNRDSKTVAEGMRKWAGSTYNSVEETVLNGKSATRANLLSEIDKMRKSAKSSDVTMVFVSGSSFEREGRAFLIPYDGEQDSNSLIPIDLLQSAIAETPGRRIAFLDLCGSELDVSLKRLTENSARDQISLLTSASPMQPASDSSAFANAVAMGMAGAAISADGKSVTIDSLGAYVTARMRQSFGATQRPVLITDDGDYVIARFVAGSKEGSAAPLVGAE
jgi:hypothetical protein